MDWCCRSCTCKMASSFWPAVQCNHRSKCCIPLQFKSDVRNTVCTCGLLDVPLHDVARLLAVDTIDVVKPPTDASDASKCLPYRLPVCSSDVASAVKACVSIGPMYQEECTSLM